MVKFMNNVLIENIEFNSTNGNNVLKGKIYIPNVKNIKGIVHIVHGMCEHIGRYDEFAKFLANNDYVVGIYDNIGHGKSINDESEYGFFSNKDGYKYLIDDVDKFVQILKKRFIGLEYTLLGHSMGSFIVRCYSFYHPRNIDRLILMGTGGLNKFVDVGIKLSSRISKIKGPKYKSNVVESMSTGMFNSYYKPNKTNYDWISLSEENVKMFIDDKLCGIPFTISGYNDLFLLNKYSNLIENIEIIPKELKILLISGIEDAVGDFGVGVESVYNMFIKTGHENVDLKLYPNLRHEILNEKCNDKVYNYILNWIKSI